jgi:exopolyphosphatase / guanosine-5'-triphosphate,3'-diphosphate pyrophosphatase
MARYGVIDLGTNTFHLLIAERDGNGFKELCRLRHFVKLAEGGIQTIGEAPYRRGMQAIRQFKTHLDEYDAKRVVATGTAALRTAGNGPEFIRQVEMETGIRVELITGDREAQLIHKGVIQAFPPGGEHMLIMDIGGGSVEFIIADGNGIAWAQSFPIGVAVLYKNFHRCDPISDDEIRQIDSFLSRQLAPLLEVLQQHPVDMLVGSSGTFDVLESMLVTHKPNPLYSRLVPPDFYTVLPQFLYSTHQERIDRQDLPDDRADMFVVALLLIDYILRNVPIREIVVSQYAMKEGILCEMMQEGDADGLMG